jgi:hypothetical protein
MRVFKAESKNKRSRPNGEVIISSLLSRNKKIAKIKNRLERIKIESKGRE